MRRILVVSLLAVSGLLAGCAMSDSAEDDAVDEADLSKTGTPLGTCGAGRFTQAFADHVAATVPAVPGNTANDQAPAFTRRIASFSGRTWTRGVDGRWASAPAVLDGYHGDLYLGDERSGAFDVIVHARTARYVTAGSSAGELFRRVFFQGAFHAQPRTAKIAGPIVLDGKLSESPWGNFGSPPQPLTFSGPVRFTNHCFSMLDAPVTATTTQVREIFATF